jgi:prepilin-type N-terminal cleavage/methylation domain-containing protein
MQLKAFTLVELIMVVAILGMMAIFVVPNYTRTVNKTYEKTGGNDLLIIYSAQKIRSNSGTGYIAAADTTAVNTNLNLNILPGGFNYSCTLPTPTTFNCRAVRTDNSFTLQVLDSNNNICCQAGACPSRPNVGTAPC